jgi:hypothetical protein
MGRSFLAERESNCGKSNPTHSQDYCAFTSLCAVEPLIEGLSKELIFFVFMMFLFMYFVIRDLISLLKASRSFAGSNTDTFY